MTRSSGLVPTEAVDALVDGLVEVDDQLLGALEDGASGTSGTSDTAGPYPGRRYEATATGTSAGSARRACASSQSIR